MIEVVCRDLCHMRTWKPRFIYFVEVRWRDRCCKRWQIRGPR